jgi:hypothetical protein
MRRPKRERDWLARQRSGANCPSRYDTYNVCNVATVPDDAGRRARRVRRVVGREWVP